MANTHNPHNPQTPQTPHTPAGGHPPLPAASTAPPDGLTAELITQLQESEARFRVMADCAPVLLWMADVSSECVFFNATWLAFTGRSLDEELGVGWAEGVHPEDFQHCMRTYTAAFAARIPFRMEYRLRRADGAYRWVLDQGVPRYTPSRAFAGFIGSCVDITAFKELHSELEARVRERTAELAAVIGELESFSYSVSHDLRAPLRTVDRFSRTLLEEHAGKLDAHGLDCLHRVRGATERMTQLINDLLELGRITRAELVRQRVDLAAIARAVVDELAPQQARAARVTIDEKMMAFGDPRLLSIALHNLIENAWKYSGKVSAPAIEIGATDVAVDGARAYFVRDNGVGFDVAHADHLFQPFQRFHAETDFPGSGVGLATVSRIVARHGGKIWAASAPGQGATFYFTLPAPAQVYR